MASTPIPTSTSDPVLMPTKYPDRYEVEVPEGWEILRSERPGVAKFTAQRSGDELPPATVDMEHWEGEWAQGRFGSSSGSAGLTREDVLKHYLALYAKVPNLTDLTILPERQIGGETAVGLTVRPVGGKRKLLWEQWYVVRHDGVWRFVISTGKKVNKDDDAAHAVLDSFRWVGPGGAEPTASES